MPCAADDALLGAIIRCLDDGPIAGEDLDVVPSFHNQERRAVRNA